MREIETEVLIIGGGAAGLNSALHLKTKNSVFHKLILQITENLKINLISYRI